MRAQPRHVLENSRRKGEGVDAIIGDPEIAADGSFRIAVKVPSESDRGPKALESIFVKAARKPTQIVAAESPTDGTVGPKHVVGTSDARGEFDFPAQTEV